MRTRGSLLLKAPGAYQTVEIELDEPRQNEILVRMVAAGLCHSDDHSATGDFPISLFPMCGGHEGSGIVERVGPNTAGFVAGDHVVFSFIPSCGKCRWCATGRQNLCDLGANTLMGARPEDGSFRMHTLEGDPVGQMAGVSTFAEHTLVNVASAIKVDSDLPLDKLSLLGCGVGTGWGSAVNSAGVAPGDTVIVMGVGGIGINAVQGAAAAGALRVIAVDPVQLKRDVALRLGATQTFASIQEGEAFAKAETNGHGADSAIVCVGVVTGQHVQQAFSAIRKAGTVVVSGLGAYSEVGIPVSLSELTLFQKRIQGSLFGASNPNSDIPRQAEMYRAGQLRLDELITSTYSLDEVRKGYEDMHSGKNIRHCRLRLTGFCML